MLARLLAEPQLGKLIVPIVPDEARTFGMEALFRTYGIYSHVGQLYEPVDSHLLMRYEERKNGQILEEGITEAGAMASFTAAGSAYATHGVSTIPFFLFYSMFGFQRVGDLIWAAGDIRTRGFLVGATAGRTTLNGEGLQHQDGHSLLHASTVPNCVSYDCAFAYELAFVIQDGIRRMYEAGESVFYYLTVYNETYHMPGLPEDVPGRVPVREGVLRGLYKLKPADPPGDAPRVHLFGSGPLLNEALRAEGSSFAGAPFRKRGHTEPDHRGAGDPSAVWRGRGCLERHELQRALSRRAELRALEPPASRRGAAPAAHRHLACGRAMAGGGYIGLHQLGPGTALPLDAGGSARAGHGRLRPE